MRRREGYSLIECLIAMALATSALTVVALTTTGVHQAQRRVERQSSSERDLYRLASQLRTDAHQARSASRENAESDTVELVLSDQGSVDYTLQKGRVVRVQHRNDDVVHQETYGLPDGYTTQWELGENGSPGMVTLKLTPVPVQEGTPIQGQPQQINAAVGLLPHQPAQAES